MSEQDNELLDSTNQSSEEDVNTTEEVVETSTEESVADTETESTESEYTEREKRLFARAKKAEELVKKLKASAPVKPNAAPSANGIPPVKDLIALSKVDPEDVDDVVEYAKFKNIPISQALKTNIVKTLLAEKAEERKTAQATSTGSQKRGNTVVSEEKLLERASSGDMPENDADIQRLISARMLSKKGK